jgi:hypothetical protein
MAEQQIPTWDRNMPKRPVVRQAVTQPSDPSYRIIALTQGQSTKVSTEDYDWLDQWNWHALWSDHTKSFYAVRNRGVGKHRHLASMAREILGCGPDEEADHRDRDTLNNTRENLRKATPLQNARNHRIQSNNKSGFVGVSWYPKYGKWRAVIYYHKKQILVGYFASKEEAVRARDKAAQKLYGEFAVLNFPGEHTHEGKS